eukprot:Gregarina_sp_Poly_1__3376@NODE_1974_length_2949_cov_72_921582_g1272_i0_p2_GENE_NODE_1974_length_2949_cov_72_921582_g1272_i0NODE_1974_length_2949_cov_72_921582_g1272_i0_p2_ORF_typecomplete_len256_score37_94RNase_T/PF00929_24/2_1e16DUF5051/PF16473_5/0_00045Ciart/PF15673_5/0_036NESP55/PF06390_12/3_9e03NESP55/PF06390_12/0_21Fes1/PF08609_10/15_NODE_1974_length_2949_cov_72_921582_g1272_i014192186
MGEDKGPFARRALVWIDLELTGLDIHKDTIVEIAVIITDHRLKYQIEGPNLVIGTNPACLSDWCAETFAHNGLLNEMKESKTTLQEAESEVLKFITKHVPEAGIGILAGSSVHVDRQWLLKYMPRITNHLHYRIVDVSGIKVLSKSWFPWIFKEDAETEQDDKSESDRESECAKEEECEAKRVDESLKATEAESSENVNEHRALHDIQQSIEQLKFLKTHVFTRERAPRRSEGRHPKPPLLSKKKNSSKRKQRKK